MFLKIQPQIVQEEGQVPLIAGFRGRGWFIKRRNSVFPSSCNWGGWRGRNQQPLLLAGEILGLLGLSAKLDIEDQLKYVNIDFSKGQRMGVLSLSLHGVFFQASASIPLKQKRECVGWHNQTMEQLSLAHFLSTSHFYILVSFLLQ